MPDERRVPRQRRQPDGLSNPFSDRVGRYVRGALLPVAAARDGVHLKGGHADDVGVSEEEADERGDLFEVPGVDGRIEDHRDLQSPRPLDVLLSHRAQGLFVRIPVSALRRVHVEGYVEETRGRELAEQRPCRANAVGE